jgi:hypothetical protein
MERLNLNVPARARVALKRIAARERRREGEVAREMLLRAIAEEERRELHRRIEKAQSPALKKRLGEISTAMEMLRGSAR